MKQAEDFLQDIVEQMENGAAVEACVEGLTHEEAEVVRLIDTMRAVPFPEENEAAVSSREVMLLYAFSASNAAASRQANKPAAGAAGLLARLRAWVGWLPAQHEMALGMALALLALIFFVVWSNMSNPPEEDAPAVAETTFGEEIAVDEPDALERSGGLSGNPTVHEGAAGEDGRIIAAPQTPQGPTVYLPVAAFPLQLTAQTAVVDEIEGVVEMQSKDGTWTALNHPTTVAAGQRIRTGNLSRTTLTFFDGSRAILNANTELSIDELNALRPADGFRTVVLTQWLGDSKHEVEFRNDGGSRYEVKSPSGTGIARGTTFRVLVTADALARYVVTEGVVDVSGAGRTVSVTAGELSTILAGGEPDEPAFTISGEGEVETTGTVWTIAGTTFETHPHTIIIGNPLVGDLVSVEGHLSEDGRRIADRIILLRRTVTDRFTIAGEVTAIGDTAWTVAGHAVAIDGDTAVDPTVAIGDSVHVMGTILADGTLLARRIVLVDPALGLPFEFSGVVELISADSWVISDRVVAIDGDTAISPDAGIGDVVAVRGVILDDVVWLAHSIVLHHDALPTFEFVGRLDSMTPWRVGLVTFETRAWTILSPGLSAGDLVRVSGTILADGTRVATAVTLLPDPTADTLVFTGIVTGIDPWIIGGVPLVVTPDSVLLGSISVGSAVRVHARLLPDGSWMIVSAWLLYPDFGYGCLSLSTPVLAVDASTITVKHWDVKIKKDGRIKIKGDPVVGTVVTLPICTGWDRTIIIVRDIVVIYKPIVIIIDDGGGGLPDGCKITKKGKVKCSGKGSKGSKGS